MGQLFEIEPRNINLKIVFNDDGSIHRAFEYSEILEIERDITRDLMAKLYEIRKKPEGTLRFSEKHLLSEIDDLFVTAKYLAIDAESANRSDYAYKYAREES